ncbi:Zn-dependent hydrolase [Marinivivus vitaminiproducens]|uniref:Zn-dependent hydrolase n=1 Tax=Marinivivus vitaminiproducens TaxID=3035935 RepID=UPI0027A2E9BF|nr:Zn-dependent hydrolase [Geminicoccaceae bacterium SCSIO 64248]
MRNLRVDGERLWRSMMTMAEIGATAKGGVCRLTLSDEDKASRDLFIEWCRAIGCTIRVDAMGNIFARRAGRNDDLPPVVIGSHLDSQPTGGKYDGAYGVLAGLEVLRTLDERAIETDRPIEVVSWTNEEGARFSPAMLGSSVYAGVADLAYGQGRTDHDGKSVGEELERIGYRGGDDLAGRPLACYIEPHIEQGPILEAEGKTIGVVTGGQGVAWYDVAVTGADAHAGPTPIAMRRDALLAAAAMLLRIRELAVAEAPAGRSTVGEFRIEPGSRNTIPGKVEFTVDLRHPERETLARMDEGLRALIAQTAGEHGVDAAVERIWLSDPIAFDADVVQAVRAGADLCGYSHREIISGAGHDAFHLSTICPTAMIFVPCKDGVSHNEAESALPGDVEAGCNVLLHAVLERARG